MYKRILLVISLLTMISTLGFSSINAAPRKVAAKKVAAKKKAAVSPEVTTVTALAKNMPHYIETLNKDAYTPEFYNMLVEACEMPITELDDYIDGTPYSNLWYGEQDPDPNYKVRNVKIVYSEPSEIHASFKLLNYGYPEEHNITIVKDDSGKWVVADFDSTFNEMVVYLNEANRAFRTGYGDKVLAEMKQDADFYGEYISRYPLEVKKYLKKYGNREPYSPRKYAKENVRSKNNYRGNFNSGAYSLECFRNYEASQPEDNEIYTEVDQIADFPGGQAALMKYLSTHMSYPEAAAQERIQGRVTVRFVVEKDGSISSAEVLKSVHPSLDNEALRLVKSMPKWQPAKIKGKPVRQWYSIPVTFRLFSY